MPIEAENPVGTLGHSFQVLVQYKGVEEDGLLLLAPQVDSLPQELATSFKELRDKAQTEGRHSAQASSPQKF